MSHGSESARDSPYGLKLLEARRTVSAFLAEWSIIIIKVSKKTSSLSFTSAGASWTNEAELGNLWLFLINIQGTAIASTSLWRDPQLPPNNAVTSMQARVEQTGQWTEGSNRNYESMCNCMCSCNKKHSTGFGLTRMWTMLMMVRAQMLARSTV